MLSRPRHEMLQMPTPSLPKARPGMTSRGLPGGAGLAFVSRQYHYQVTTTISPLGSRLLKNVSGIV